MFRLFKITLKPVCRKCIYEKLSDEEMDCCPVCEIDLGCLPVEKLRYCNYIPKTNSFFLTYRFTYWSTILVVNPLCFW